MSKDKAWLLANRASDLAYEARQELLRPVGLFSKQTKDMQPEMFAILEMIAGAIQELTIPDKPLRLQDLQIGLGSAWWE